MYPAVTALFHLQHHSRLAGGHRCDEAGAADRHHLPAGVGGAVGVKAQWAGYNGPHREAVGELLPLPHRHLGALHGKRDVFKRRRGGGAVQAHLRAGGLELLGQTH